jgi:cyclopropane fatty-acyl-phospholipid synthase-like methyltransferase
MTDFDQVTNYTNYIEDDPFRRGLHFPAIEEALGDLNKKRILEIGCGDGLFSRLLAERGAAVVGYDRALQKIAEAQARVCGPGLDATFVVATPYTFFHDGTFDAAMSVMVLQYATSPEELAAFFRSASRHLGPGGRFISVVINPSFSAFGQDFVVRRFHRLESNNMRSEFLDRASGRVEMILEAHQFTSEEFEQAAISGGMRPAAWRKLFATPDAVRQLGTSFWQPCHEHQPFALFVTQKD